MAKEFWYNDSGTWRKAVEFYYNDNGTWRTIKEGWYNDSGTWRQFYTNITGTVSLASVSSRYRAVADPSTATAQVQFVADGQHSGIPTMSGNWYSPTTTGIGNSYWIRITLLSGDALTVNDASGWTQLSSNRQAYVSQSGIGTKSSDIRIEISTDSGGSTIVATKDINLTAEVF
jgi:hypothetical protein